ncbi:MAG: helix-turn-helix domain-containing protein [Bacteroides sp.]|nr:helix-turn-helix domain-containing protein [Bacteroides sp.]
MTLSPKNVCSPLKGQTFIDDKELAERLSLHRRTLQNFRNETILPYYKIRGKVIYDEAEIEAWLNSNYYPRY